MNDLCLHKIIQDLDTSNTDKNHAIEDTILESLWSGSHLKDAFQWDHFDPHTAKIGNALRNTYTSHGIYGIPCIEAIDDIKKAVPEHTILEVMGGTGYLSHWLRIHGNMDVICTGLQLKDWQFSKAKQWVPVELLKASEAVLKYPDRTVLVSWIPCGGCDDNDDILMLQNMAPGQQLILIGEDTGGCTGSEWFFDTLNDNFEECGSGRWVSARYIHDTMRFFKKNKRDEK